MRQSRTLGDRESQPNMTKTTSAITTPSLTFPGFLSEGIHAGLCMDFLYKKATARFETIINKA
jgi:hypothetical protein